jgi:hypothetical protein
LLILGKQYPKILDVALACAWVCMTYQ